MSEQMGRRWPGLRKPEEGHSGDPMPYIKQDRREAVERYLAGIDRTDEAYAPGDAPQDCGELNYAITMTALRHQSLSFRGMDSTFQKIGWDYLHAAPLRYQRINDVAGAFACAYAEMSRRCPNRKYELITLMHAFRPLYVTIAADYEQIKIRENGDIAEYGNRP